jgi:hypothetical protein
MKGVLVVFVELLSILVLLRVLLEMTRPLAFLISVVILVLTVLGPLVVTVVTVSVVPSAFFVVYTFVSTVSVLSDEPPPRAEAGCSDGFLKKSIPSHMLFFGFYLFVGVTHFVVSVVVLVVESSKLLSVVEGSSNLLFQLLLFQLGLLGLSQVFLCGLLLGGDGENPAQLLNRSIMPDILCWKSPKPLEEKLVSKLLSPESPSSMSKTVVVLSPNESSLSPKESNHD